MTRADVRGLPSVDWRSCSAVLIGDWVAGHRRLLEAVLAVRELDPAADAALESLLAVPRIRRFQVSWELFHALMSAEGADPDMLLVQVMGTESVDLVRAAVFGDYDLPGAQTLLDRPTIVVPIRPGASRPDGDEALEERPLGQRLRDRRQRLEMTRAQAAGLLGVHQSTVGKWERGARPDPGWLHSIAAFLSEPLESVALGCLRERSAGWGRSDG